MAPFFISTPNGMDYQVTFFIQVTEFARECAKGHSAKTAWERAEKVAANFSPTVNEAIFADLMSIWQDTKTFIEVSFLLNGENRTAKVWYADKYPTVA